MHVHRFLAPSPRWFFPWRCCFRPAPLKPSACKAQPTSHHSSPWPPRTIKKPIPASQSTSRATAPAPASPHSRTNPADVAMSDVAVNDADFNDTILGVVGFAFALNPDVGVKNLTRGELQDIFSGKITNWKAIGGNDRKIVLIGRQIGTGTRFVFEDKVAKTEIPITIEPNAKAVVEAVAQTSGALGYLASGFVDGHDNLIVSYEGVMPTPANIRNHTYSFSTDEHLYMLKNGPAAAAAFIQYVKNDAALLKDNGVF